jgi:hypothetical protein
VPKASVACPCEASFGFASAIKWPRRPVRSRRSARQHDVGRQLRWDRLRHPKAKAWQVNACEQGFTTAQNDGRQRQLQLVDRSCEQVLSSSLVSPNRVSLPRFHVRIGLHIVLFEVCSAFTRVAACTLARSPYVVTAIRRLQTLRLLHVCSGRFRLERSPGGACTHWKSAALSRRTWKADLRRHARRRRGCADSGHSQILDKPRGPTVTGHSLFPVRR